MQAHHKETNEIRGGKRDLIGSALHFSSCIIGLQQIIQHQIMNGKEHAHAENGDKQDPIIYGIIRPARTIQQNGKPRSDHQSRQQIDLHNFPQADLKQLQNISGLFIERIRQKTVIAVHKKSLRKARSPIYRIHDKNKIRQAGHEQFIGLFSDIRQKIKDKKAPHNNQKTNQRNPAGGLP